MRLGLKRTMESLTVVACALGGCDEGDAQPRELGSMDEDRKACGAADAPCPSIENFRVADFSLELDLIGAGDAAIAPDGVPDAAFEVTLEGPVTALSLVPVFPDGSLYYYWHYDTVVGDNPIDAELDDYWSVGAETWVLGVWDRGAGGLANDDDGSVTLDDGVRELVLLANDSEIHGRGLSWRLVVTRPGGYNEVSTIVSDTKLVALESLDVAASMGQADRVGPGDLGLSPDGSCNLAFNLELTGRVKSLAVVGVDAAGNPQGQLQWDTIVGDALVPPAIGAAFGAGSSTWALGVFASYDDTFALNPSGPLVEDRNLWTRTVRLYGAGAEYVAGGPFRAAAELHDGSVVFSPVLGAGDPEFGSCSDAPACCAAVADAGCEDANVETCVCAFDPYCCEIQWDLICVGEAEGVCGAAC